MFIYINSRNRFQFLQCTSDRYISISTIFVLGCEGDKRSHYNKNLKDWNRSNGYLTSSGNKSLQLLYIPYKGRYTSRKKSEKGET